MKPHCFSSKSRFDTQMQNLDPKPEDDSNNSCITLVLYSLKYAAEKLMLLCLPLYADKSIYI